MFVMATGLVISYLVYFLLNEGSDACIAVQGDLGNEETEDVKIRWRFLFIYGMAVWFLMAVIALISICSGLHERLSLTNNLLVNLVANVPVTVHTVYLGFYSFIWWGRQCRDKEEFQHIGNFIFRVFITQIVAQITFYFCT